jgi:multidrug resistance efflux pump
MPGMNKSSRTIGLILSLLARLETDESSTALDALGLLDEIRRLRRKWDEQVAAGSPRRIEADFREMNGWLRRWTIAAKRVLARDDLTQLREAVDAVQRELKQQQG